MKNTIIILVIILVNSAVVFSQPKYFQKKYEIGTNRNNYLLAMSARNGNFIFTGQSSNWSQTDTHPFLLTINSLGEVIETQEFTYDEFESSGNTILNHNDSLIIAGWNKVNEVGGSTYAYLLDTNNIIYDQKIVGSTQYTNHAQTVCRTPDGGFLLGGEIQPYDSTVVGPPTHPYLIRLDPQGNVLWDTIYYNCCTTYYSRINKLLPAPGGGYYAISTRDINFYFGDAMLLKIDENGNIEWSKFIDYGHIEYTDDMILMPDGGYLLTGGTANHDDFPFTQSGLIVKLNADLEEEWHRVDLFEGYVACKVALADDGNIFIIGGQDLLSSSLDVELCKISPSGQLLWQRFYGSSQDDYAWAMLPASDGGFVIGGRTRENDTARVTVLKVNCMGLLTEPQAAFSTYQTGDSPLEVGFQNLSQYVYPDSIDGGYYVWDFGDGSPPFVCGQGYGACPALVTHEYAAQGQYTATLTAFVCTDTTTVTQSVAAVWTGADAVVASPAEELHFIPNPASNTASIAYNLNDAEGNSETATLHLYDTVGKLLHTQTLNGQGSYTLDLNSFGRGLYVYDISNSSRTWTRGKLTVTK